LRCERLSAKNDFCDEQTHVRPRAAGVSPPWFSGPHLQVQSNEFWRFVLVCGVCFTGGLRPPAPDARCWAGAPNAEAVTKNSGHAGPWNPSVADWGMDPLTASRVVRLLPRLWNRNLVDWGMERPTASRVVRLLPRLWNRSLVDCGMELPTADRGDRLLPRLWNRSVTDRTMDRGAVQDLFTADRCGLLSRAAGTVNPGGRAKKARMRAIANCQWHSGSRQPRCHSEKRFHTGPGIWKE